MFLSTNITDGEIMTNNYSHYTIKINKSIVIRYFVNIIFTLANYVLCIYLLYLQVRYSTRPSMLNVEKQIIFTIIC